MPFQLAITASRSKIGPPPGWMQLTGDSLAHSASMAS
jgi:hypothetical protein